ncbi:hypothetical protein PR003_g28522 [Phytophthora rubi]|uniref:Secreted protein n=1 Tax=Phytophthora rubi TaxID=129364 RepID=A0A6A3HD00_9STRA|nr:hypothetical protein PR002_g28235 [Phytophthora rubi]KAE8968796.1 hypothetical protein PR001_g27687 [Phytophthora rubi]KAE9278445.1 hypothetical protein PR003_g28522 [Phytophthora rubi]
MLKILHWAQLLLPSAAKATFIGQKAAERSEGGPRRRSGPIGRYSGTAGTANHRTHQHTTPSSAVSRRGERNGDRHCPSGALAAFT